MAPAAKKAKLSAGGTGNIASFFGVKKSVESGPKASPKASPKPESPRKAEPKASPKPEKGGTTPSKDEPKPMGPTPEKLSPQMRRVATPCVPTKSFAALRGLKPSGWQQYNALYKLRLKQLSGAVQDASMKWELPNGSRLSDLTQLKPGTEHEVVAVGVLFKDLKQRPNIIEEPLTARDRRRPLSLGYKGSKGLLNDWKEEPTQLHSLKDTLWLEDSVMRVELEVAPELLERLCTGLVVAVRGTATQAGTLHVLDVCFPRIPPAPALSSRADGCVALCSGLRFGTACPLRQKAMDFLLQAGDVQQLVVCGGLFGSETKAALAEINQELPRLLQRMAVQVMPGQGEPSNTSLPQLQFHKSLFQFESPNFRPTGNPCGFQLGGMELLGHSGQPVKDMQRSMAMEPLDALEMSLRARHLAPTAPDTLPTQPFEDADPFVLEATPHVLFSGGHERAQHRWHGGQQGTQCICVPSFDQHPALVLVNLQNPWDVRVQDFS